MTRRIIFTFILLFLVNTQISHSATVKGQILNKHSLTPYYYASRVELISSDSINGNNYSTYTGDDIYSFNNVKLGKYSLIALHHTSYTKILDLDISKDTIYEIPIIIYDTSLGGSIYIAPIIPKDTFIEEFKRTTDEIRKQSTEIIRVSFSRHNINWDKNLCISPSYLSLSLWTFGLLFKSPYLDELSDYNCKHKFKDDLISSKLIGLYGNQKNKKSNSRKIGDIYVTVTPVEPQIDPPPKIENYKLNVENYLWLNERLHVKDTTRNKLKENYNINLVPFNLDTIDYNFQPNSSLSKDAQIIPHLFYDAVGRKEMDRNKLLWMQNVDFDIKLTRPVTLLNNEFITITNDTIQVPSIAIRGGIAQLNYGDFYGYVFNMNDKYELRIYVPSDSLDNFNRFTGYYSNADLTYIHKKINYIKKAIFVFPDISISDSQYMNNLMIKMGIKSIFGRDSQLKPNNLIHELPLMASMALVKQSTNLKLNTNNDKNNSETVDSIDSLKISDDEKLIVIDKPFIYRIYKKYHDEIMIMGTFVNK